MEAKKPYVVFMGGPCVDKYFDAEAWPEIGNKVSVWHRGNVCGGLIANAACVCAGYGIETYSFDIKGEGPDTEMLFEDMEKSHVHMDKAQIIPGKKDTYCVIYQLPSGEHTLMVVNGTKHPIDLTDDLREFFLGASYIYGTLDWSAYFNDSWGLLEELKAKGVRIMLDCESSFNSEEARRMIGYATTVSFNEFAAELYGNGKTFEEFRDELFAKGVETIILTLAEKGAKIVTRDGEWQVGCYDVDPVDTTGAGDTFNSSFCVAKVMGLSDPEALRFANAAANMSVTVQGPRGGITTREKVEEFMRTHTPKDER
ncbi:MAG: carbohydrate kinase family protein [Oscillospiraceae bacterium]|nr:carbohydrate kinase family protein [Oscillospiraceae bacterium]